MHFLALFGYHSSEYSRFTTDKSVSRAPTQVLYWQVPNERILFSAFIHTVAIRMYNMGKAFKAQQIMLIESIRNLLMISLGRKVPSAGNTDVKEMIRSFNALRFV